MATRRQTADDPVISKRSALLFTTDKRPTKHTSPRRNSDADGGPDSRKRRRKGLLVVSIGDCKVYLYSHASGTIKDLTEGNRFVCHLRTSHTQHDSRLTPLDAHRQNATSVNDCGGRLGPASGMESTEPDLRNLDLYFAECDEGDCVWAVSDGVHDNFDPQMLGLMPHDLDEQQVQLHHPLAVCGVWCVRLFSRCAPSLDPTRNQSRGTTSPRKLQRASRTSLPFVRSSMSYFLHHRRSCRRRCGHLHPRRSRVTSSCDPLSPR